ncbi:MAG: PAAR domain-containing protein [Acidobacteriota bacterium]
MSQPAAKLGDQILATDTHVIVTPSGAAAPVPHPFAGSVDGDTSSDVLIEGQPAATVGSTANNAPPHVPQGGSFQTPPSNRGSITVGSGTVLINGSPAARMGDTATTCNDPADQPVGQVLASGSVLIGG